MADIFSLFTPPDVAEAYAEWKCNCGPSALAAIRGLTCAEVRPHFPGHEARGFTNPTQMTNALKYTGGCFRIEHQPATYDHGILWIQFGGSWLNPGVPERAAYQRTHWLAVDGGMFYDVNCGWVTREEWSRPDGGVVAYLMDAIPRCDRTWFVRTAYHVKRKARVA